jgi:MFS family permease
MALSSMTGNNLTWNHLFNFASLPSSSASPSPLSSTTFYCLTSRVCKKISPSLLAGVVFLSVPLGMGIMGMLGGYLTGRYGAKWFILTGSALLLAGLLLFSLVARTQTSELDVVWRLLLVRVGIGLFTGPNRTQLMSIGPRETMGAASALSNLSARLGTVFGSLALAVTWAFFTSFPAQINAGIFIVDGFAVINLLLAWLSVYSS